MKNILKTTLNMLCLGLIFPCYVTVLIEGLFAKGGEEAFSFWAHFFAIVPGLPGVFLRRAFYHLALDSCSLNCHIGFGTVFSHRRATVEDNVSIGLYAVIGSASIGKNCEIASRVSITSGRHQHIRGADGSWSPFDPTKAEQIRIGSNVWIGEGAIVMANLGDGSMIGAGAVVTKEVPANVVAAGNPAKILRKL